MKRYWLALLDILLGEERTVSLERFFAATTLVCGLWVLSPWWPSFGDQTTLAMIPEWATGAILLMHGLLYSWALWPPEKVGICRRAALANSAMFYGVTITFVLIPPRTLFVVPITAAIATGSFLVYQRLGLLFHDKP